MTADTCNQVWNACPDEIFAWNGQGIFSFGEALVISDGTAQGTGFLQHTGGDSAYFATALGQVFFRSGPSGDMEPWKTDGTAGGTAKLADVAPGINEASYPFSFVEFDGLVFFSAKNDDVDRELWASDGNEAGTYLVADLSSYDSYPQNLTPGQERLFFSASTQDFGHELWATDGTEPGTYLVKDVFPGASSSILRSSNNNPENQFAFVDGILFFAANNGATGTELWKSDGTLSGTVMVTDLLPGPLGSDPKHLTAFGGRVFFAATDGEAGHELWATDGTQLGTELVADICPGLAGSNPANLIVSDGTLFFTAFLEGHQTLFGLRLTPSADIYAQPHLCLSSSGYTAWVQHVSDQSSYVWTATNAVIDSGQGSSVITFSTGPTGPPELDVQVTLLGQSNTGHLTLNAFSGSPALPAAIQGDTEFCPHPGLTTFSVPEQVDATTYQWTVPADAVIWRGQGTHQIEVFLGGMSGAVSVTPENPCGVGLTQSLSVTIHPGASHAYAGPDQSSCSAYVTLQANEPLWGVGQWHILQGSGGVLSDALDPETCFEGLLGETYVLEWRIELAPCEDTSDRTTVVFAAPISDVDAGPDMTACGDTIELQGSDPGWAEGTWSILSGDGGVLDNPWDPHATLTGMPGESYVLQWVVQGFPCATTFDEVAIFFNGELMADAGEPACLTAGQSKTLDASVSGGSGLWTVVSGPDTSSSQFSDDTNPHSRFTPFGGPGDYELSWTVSAPNCDDASDVVFISVFPPEVGLENLHDFDVQAIPGDSSKPFGFIAGDDRVFFLAEDPVHSQALWRTTGTEAGTRMVQELKFTYYGGPMDICQVGDQVFFRAQNPLGDYELWVMDPVTEDIRMVRDNSYYYLENPHELTAFHGYCFFEARSGELWRSDGTPGGTFKVGPDHVAMTGLTVFNDQLFYTALSGSSFDYDGTVYASDGTRAGTQPFGGVNPLELYAKHYLVHEDQLLFVACDGAGRERHLWVTDGIREHSVQLTGSDPESELQPTHLTAMGPHVFFSGLNHLGRELWRTDGTVQGTVMVKDLEPGTASGLSSTSELVALGNTLIFTGAGGLWRTDGSALGTVQLLEDSCAYLAAMGPHVYFSRDESSHGEELWRTDGTPEGTTMVRDIIPGTSDSSPRYLMSHDGLLYFSASCSSGREPFVSDGTEAGTQLLKDLAVDTSNVEIDPYEQVILNGQVVYAFDDGVHGNELWTTTSTGFDMLIDLNPGVESSDPEDFFVHEELLYFTCDLPGMGRELWRTDGTPQGTLLIVDNYGATSSSPAVLGADSGRVLFTSRIPSSSDEPWITDGTAAGTVYLGPADPQGFSVREFLGTSDGLFYFTSFDSVAETEPWRTDGTVAGTVLLGDINPSYSSDPTSFFPWNGGALFVAEVSSSTYEVWYTDGTPSGTISLSPVVSSTDYGSLGDQVLYAGEGGELWVTDGTPAGSHLVLEIYYGSGRSYPRDFITLGDVAVFIATDSSSKGLWSSDGTTAGTTYLHGFGTPVMLGQVGPRVLLSGDNYLWATDGTVEGTLKMANAKIESAIIHNGLLFFSGWTLDRGRELWVSDGTVQNTRIMADLYPGPANSNPDGFMSIGHRLYFQAQDPQHGRELWYTDGYCTEIVADLVTGPGRADLTDVVYDSDQLFGVATYGGEASLFHLAESYVNIPDPALRAAVLAQFDSNGDDLLSRTEAMQIEILNCVDMGIRRLNGIESMPALRILDVSENRIEDASIIWRNPGLGTQPDHLIDLRYNALDLDDCPDVLNIQTVVDLSGAELRLNPQRYFIMPTLETWPDFNVIDLLFGTWTTGDPLDCSATEQREGRRQ